MAVRKDALNIARLRSGAADATLPPEKRLRTVRSLVRKFPSIRNIAAAKQTCAALLELQDITPEFRQKVLDFQFKLRAGDFDNSEPDESEEAVVKPTPEFKIPGAGFQGEIVQIVKDRNQDLERQPVPQKHLYYEKSKPGSLAEIYGELFNRAGFSATDIPSAFFDPYNDLPSPIARCVNPLFVKSYLSWFEKRYGDKMPDRSSDEFLLFANDYDVRRWVKLGTLVGVPAERPVGRELRRRWFADGRLKREEIPYFWVLWFSILLGKTKFWMLNADTPSDFMNEGAQ